VDTPASRGVQGSNYYRPRCSLDHSPASSGIPELNHNPFDDSGLSTIPHIKAESLTLEAKQEVVSPPFFSFDDPCFSPERHAFTSRSTASALVSFADRPHSPPGSNSHQRGYNGFVDRYRPVQKSNSPLLDSY